MLKAILRIFTLVFACSLLFFGGLVQAQTDNLLENPGFESPFVDQGGNPARQVAQGWTPWHVSAPGGGFSWQNQQPEYVETAPNALRIRSGENAQMYFSYFATHEGGVLQRVTGITPGTELRFSVYAYIWSSTFSDPDESELPGGITFQVGIDPTGGTDGTSDDIIWSVAPPTPLYDVSFRQYAVIAEAVSNAVTVFVRSQVEEPVENNVIYLDDAVLEITPESGQGQQDPATDTPQPEPTDTPQPEPTDTPQPQATDTPQPEPTESDEDPTPTAEGALPVTNTPTSGETDVTPDPGGTEDAPLSDEFPNNLLHTVRPNETVGQLATLYGSTVEAIRQANDLSASNLIFIDDVLVIPVRLPAPATITPTNTPQNQQQQPPSQQNPTTTAGTYVVQPGDTLYRIALRYNTSVAALANLNGIVNTSRIAVGQVLQVPVPGGTPEQPPQPPAESPQQQTYVIQFGDTLYRIAVRFGISPQRLAEANGITNVNLIYWGQTLVIP